MVKAGIKQMTGDLLALFYPRLCAACNGHLVEHEDAICLQCLLELPRTNDEHDPVDNPVARVFWGRIYLESAASCFVFSKGGKVQDLIHNLKYNDRRDAGI